MDLGDRSNVISSDSQERDEAKRKNPRRYYMRAGLKQGRDRKERRDALRRRSEE